MNISTRTVTVPQKAVLCELQPVTVQKCRSLKEKKPQYADIMGKIKIYDHNLDVSEFQKGFRVIRAFNDIFSKHNEDI
jgi:hypothetical protein